MKGKVYFLFLIMLFPFFLVFSQRPKDISLNADFANNSIKIVITHIVTNPRKHYIRMVEVTVDDQKPLVYRFFFQRGDKKTFSVDIPDLGGVKKITVKAYPDRGGTLEKKFDIKSLKKKTQ